MTENNRLYLFKVLSDDQAGDRDCAMTMPGLIYETVEGLKKGIMNFCEVEWLDDEEYTSAERAEITLAFEEACGRIDLGKSDWDETWVTDSIRLAVCRSTVVTDDEAYSQLVSPV